MSRSRSSFRRAVAAGSVFSALLLAGCSSGGTGAAGSSGGGSGNDCVRATGGKVTVVTKKFDFEPGCITAAPGSLTVRYDNTEKGVEHNFHLRDAKTASGPDRTDLKAGPDVQTITYVNLKPGRYTFVCDLHPAMKGTVTVSGS